MEERRRGITIKLIRVKPSLLLFPDALFDVLHQFKWRERFLVGLGYLYALVENFNVVRISMEELMKVMDTEDIDEIYEFLAQVETLNRLVVIEAEGIKKNNFVKFKSEKEGKLKVEIELVPLPELSYLFPNGEFFPVPNIMFLLPISVQAKAIYLLLCYLKKRNRNSQTIIVSYETIAKELMINTGDVKNYLQELIELNLVVQEKGESQYILREIDCLNSELFLRIQKVYGSNHPFFKYLNVKSDEKGSFLHL